MSLSIRLFGNRDRAQELIGEAKRQMVLLKRFMGFGNLSQLEPQSIRMSDGSTIRVRSIFGIDIIDIIGVKPIKVAVEEGVGESYFVFLYTDSNSYVVWKITNGGATIKPYSFPIHQHIEDFYGYTEHINPSTCKSSKDYDAHVIAIETFYHWSLTSTYRRYGTEFTTAGVQLMFGLRNSFEPVSWIHPNITKFNWDTSYKTKDYYFSSGRNNWQIIEGFVLKDIEIIHNPDEVREYIEYNSINGHQVGMLLPNMDPTDFLSGPLSIDKFIGKDPDSYQSTTNQPSWKSMPRMVCAGESPYTYRAGPGEWYEKIDGYNWGFGDHILTYTNWYEKGNIAPIDGPFTTIPKPSMSGKHPCGWNGVECTAADVTYIEGIGDQYSGSPYLMDYDNLIGTPDRKPDDSFISIYFIGDGQAKHKRLNNTSWDNIGTGWSGYYQNGVTGREFRLHYKTIEQDPLYESICDMGYIGLTTWSWSGLTFDTDAYGCTYLTGFTQNQDYVGGFMGQRVVKTSTKASEKYLLYTYIIQDFTGNPTVQDHYQEYNDASFTFNRRILGIINNKTGARYEYIVDEALLGDKYKDKFNVEVASAIGLHIIKG